MTKRGVSAGLVAAVSAAALAIGPGAAWAGAFGLREQSVIGLGDAFAGAASGAAGLSSLYWNPATITMYPGWTSEANATYVSPSARIDTQAPTPTLGLGQAGDIGLDGVVPATFTAYQLTESLWLGLASTSPFGLVTKPNDVWAGQTYSRSSRVFSANFAPILGYKVNEYVSIAAGPTVEYFKTRLNSAVAASPLARTAILEGDDVSVGATVGITITPVAGTTIGVGYRSSIHHELEGTLRVPVGLTGASINTAKVSLNLPDQLNLGITQAITTDFRLNFGFEFTNWSRLKTPAVVLDATGKTATTVPLGYKDGYYVSLGGEYQMTPRWTLRAGVAYELSPIDVSNRGTRVPDTDRIHATIGTSYKVTDKLDLSLSYAHIFAVGNNRISIVPGNVVYNQLPLFADVKAEVNLVGVSATYRWDDPRVAQASPMVRKY